MGTLSLFDAPPAVDYHTARSARCDVVVDWLAQVGAIAPSDSTTSVGLVWTQTMSDTHYRTLYRMQHEQQVMDFYVLDELCCAIGRHVSEVPASAWLPWHPNGVKPELPELAACTYQAHPSRTGVTASVVAPVYDV